VPQNHGSPTGDIIDQGIAILIVEVGTFGFLDKYGSSPHRLEGSDGGIDPARNDFLGGLE